MLLWLILTLVFIALEVVSVTRDIKRLEYLAKPATMFFLFLWLYSSTGLVGNIFWFGLGILFSLAGDVLLIFERLFLPGLIAFLLAHISYISGLRAEIVNLTAWSFILAIFIAINVGRLLQRIVGSMRRKDERGLTLPVLLYGTVISVMLYAAMSTIFDPAWKTSAAFFVSAGAFCFCASDAILAWNKFVSPIQSGRTVNLVLYYLGQVGIIAGVIAQFG